MPAMLTPPGGAEEPINRGEPPTRFPRPSTNDDAEVRSGHAFGDSSSVQAPPRCVLLRVTAAVRSRKQGLPQRITFHFTLRIAS